ncbi:S10 family serine carboxypeptidase-like protein [Roseiterribacter gracilis]|uniref:Peptidase S10 n=1 Tax=Roseiterribacter gracilis TaxID=2812848 RepID=A0A8S8XI61_9PROT|nr:peptidase S10 [Rhodospirillales bacterium TMPK1]
MIIKSLLLAALLATATPPLLVPGDEPVVVTQHQLKTARGALAYEARTGRIPIRNDETGEVRGHIFFIAYTVKSRTPRPLTFAWNGGPTSASYLLHTEVLGPRRIEGAKFVDNAETLLYTTDLVFMDPVGTGFSRTAKPEFDKEFLSTLGDFAATAEFIRAYRVRFGVEQQPFFLLGESYGTWRVNGTTELLTKRGENVAGAILISGGIPGSQMPVEFNDAFYAVARTASAFEHKRLAPDLMRDRAATLKQAEDWVEKTYLPALQKKNELTDAEREKIAQDLARFTGVKPEQIDRKTLVMSNRDYLRGFFDGDKDRVLNTYDMRIAGAQKDEPGRAQAIVSYLRDELGYRTDLAYTGLEDGYMPTPGPARRSTGSRWVYDHTEITPELMARMQGGGGPPASQPWLQNAMRSNKALRVFVGAGQYDSLNMCAGNLRMTAKLEPDLAGRFTNRCYEGGHMMYRDQPTRLALSKDLERFIAESAKK